MQYEMRCDLCFDRPPHTEGVLPSPQQQSSHPHFELSIGNTPHSFRAQLCKKNRKWASAVFLNWKWRSRNALKSTEARRRLWKAKQSQAVNPTLLHHWWLVKERKGVLCFSPGKITGRTVDFQLGIWEWNGLLVKSANREHLCHLHVCIKLDWDRSVHLCLECGVELAVMLDRSGGAAIMCKEKLPSASLVAISAASEEPELTFRNAHWACDRRSCYRWLPCLIYCDLQSLGLCSYICILKKQTLSSCNRKTVHFWPCEQWLWWISIICLSTGGLSL